MKRQGSLGRRGFLKVTAAGIAVAGAGLPAAEAGAPGIGPAAARGPAAQSDAAGARGRAGDPFPEAAQVARARWRERRVDHGEVAHILVVAPGAADGTVVTATVHHLVSGFERRAGTARGQVQAGEARLEFLCSGLGKVEREGVQALGFRVRVGDGDDRLVSPRPLEVLFTRARFSA